MGWTVGCYRPRETELIDAVLLAVGRALHMANAFEAKCTFVLRTANAATIAEQDPVATLQEIISRTPRDRLLAATLRDLERHFTVAQPAAFQALDDARRARNFIAHEGAAFGEMRTIGRRALLEHVARLREAVAGLAKGDNVVSLWCFRIEEPEQSIPSDLVSGYPDMVDQWVFGHLVSRLDDLAAGTVPEDPSGAELLRERVRLLIAEHGEPGEPTAT